MPINKQDRSAPAASMNRRQALTRLGLGATAIYSAPLLLNLSSAAANSGGSGGGSNGGSRGGSNGASRGGSNGGSRGSSGPSRGAHGTSRGGSRGGSAGASDASLGERFSRDLARLGRKAGTVFE